MLGRCEYIYIFSHAKMKRAEWGRAGVCWIRSLLDTRTLAYMLAYLLDVRMDGTSLILPIPLVTRMSRSLTCLLCIPHPRIPLVLFCMTCRPEISMLRFFNILIASLSLGHFAQLVTGGPPQRRKWWGGIELVVDTPHREGLGGAYIYIIDFYLVLHSLLVPSIPAHIYSFHHMCIYTYRAIPPRSD
jgi:hypothetical protein